MSSASLFLGDTLIDDGGEGVRKDIGQSVVEMASVGYERERREDMRKREPS
jgi:hypothetical protein